MLRNQRVLRCSAMSVSRVPNVVGSIRKSMAEVNTRSNRILWRREERSGGSKHLKMLHIGNVGGNVNCK